ncbi:DUF4326 domain-containing protein, partial [Escherichia coli]|uniref:DUF4326 domain-containing protein n=1 Tax=Escherichia coli TaxID=562 RepID=UPI00359F457D
MARWHRSGDGRVFPTSRWANPFKLRDCPSIDVCLNLYRSYILADPALLQSLSELTGRNLVCHCRTGSRCHVDILIEIHKKYLGDKIS